MSDKIVDLLAERLMKRKAQREMSREKFMNLPPEEHAKEFRRRHPDFERGLKRQRTSYIITLVFDTTKPFTDEIKAGLREKLALACIKTPPSIDPEAGVPSTIIDVNIKEGKGTVFL